MKSVNYKMLKINMPIKMIQQMDVIRRNTAYETQSAFIRQALREFMAKHRDTYLVTYGNLINKQ